jgi:glycerate dehydrogenase
MKIVVLDGYTLNPGDLSWAELEALGSCESRAAPGALVVFDRTPPDQVVARAKDAEIILTNKTVLDGKILRQLPRLRYIGVLATGYNVVDIQAARERHIPVTNVPTYGTPSVAQMVFAHVLELTQHVAHHAQTVRDGRWTKSADFCYWDFPLIELKGLTMGIVGYGRIGRETGAVAKAFGMKVLAVELAPKPEGHGAEFVSLDELFRRSDVVSLHCPLTPETKGLVNAQRLSLMKRTAFLINTSRGPLMEEQALADALNSGRIAGAGLDVLAVEPPSATNPLLQAKNCHITPHIAWATRAARERLMKTAIENVRLFLAGSRENVVN